MIPILFQPRDTTPGGATDVITLSGTTTSGILLSGGAGYIKKSG